jgi:C-terminal processing protease CtpA/Prc
MLAELHDIHVWIETPAGRIQPFGSSYGYNGNHAVVREIIENAARCGDFAVVATTKPDGFGYFLMANQSAASDETVQQAIDAIEKLHDAPGFIVDLRQANGGDELLARRIAQLFCAKDTVYAKSKYRGGAAHGVFTEEFPRTLLEAKNPFKKPVVCLIGPGAVSSGEGFVQMMKCLPQVTTVGLPTRGASGNPRPFEIPGADVTVWFSRWVDLMPDGKSFEGRGIAPEVIVDKPATDYARSDLTLDQGLEIRRQKIALIKSAEQ